MKKIFTLIAVAAMALSVNAQEKLLLENGATYIDNQELTTDNTKLVLGNDIKKATKWDNKAASHKTYLEDFSQLVPVMNEETGETENKPRIVYIVGGNNPKDDTANKGGGFNGSGETGKLPQSGTYYVITPAQNGKIKAGIILNADKEFFIIDATDKVATEEGYLTVENATANITHDKYVITADGEDGGEVLNYTDEAPTDHNGLYDGGKGGVKVVDKTQGTVEFSVQANHTYYMFCTGSKLSFFGYIFTAGGTEGIETVKATTQNKVIYNLAGQKVDNNYKGIAIQNGKKIVK